jgi:hypothetical protein
MKAVEKIVETLTAVTKDGEGRTPAKNGGAVKVAFPNL